MDPIQVANPSSPTNGDRTGCPPPIAWQEVLANFREQADPWELARGKAVVRGRTWGNGPPLYFLNGFSNSCELYALLVWLLRDSFRCTLMNYREQPARRWGAGPVSIEELAEDVLAVADWQGDDAFDLFATSFGVPVGLKVMLSAPQRVRRAILQGGFARLDFSFPERIIARLGGFLPGRLKHIPFRSKVQQTSHRHWFPPLDHSRFDFLLNDTGSARIACVASRAQALANLDLRSCLSNISQPVQLLAGEGDGRVRSARIRELAEQIPGSRFEELHSCGQLPYLTHPHRIANVIRDFLGIGPDSENAIRESSAGKLPDFESALK